MASKWMFRITLSMVAIIVVTTVFLGLVETNQYSAYAACRKLALTTKGYGVWNHAHTLQLVFSSRISFSDGYNELSCTTNGVGPFWVVQAWMKTNVACVNSLTDQGADICPEDYFGVKP